MALWPLDLRLRRLHLSHTIRELQEMGNKVAEIRAKIRIMEDLYRQGSDIMDVQSYATLVHSLRTVSFLLENITNKAELRVIILEPAETNEEE
jgi:hypothetical protein